jgi:hypothetical protein
MPSSYPLKQVVLFKRCAVNSGCRNPASPSSRRNRETEGGKARWKLFHHEEGPAPERNIIDTSEWTWANDRYVIGQHFGV